MIYPELDGAGNWKSYLRENVIRQNKLQAIICRTSGNHRSRKGINLQYCCSPVYTMY